MFQPPEWPLLILLFLRSRAFLHTLTPLLKLDKSTTNKKTRIPTNISKYVWLKELEFDFSYPNSPQPNGASPRNCGPVQEGEQGVQMHKSTLLGNEDFHLKKNCLFHLHVQPGSLGWKKFPENPRFFFCSLFPWLFPGFEHGKQSTSDRWEELWTNDPILQPKKQTFQILGIFTQFTQKTPIAWIMIITKPQPVALECFPRQKRGQIAFAVWCGMSVGLHRIIG